MEHESLQQSHLVGMEHINALVYAGLRTRDTHCLPLTWPVFTPELEFAGNHELTEATTHRVGQMLLDANVQAVNLARNEENAYFYSYTPPKFTSWSTVEFLKAVRWYESCAAGGDLWAFSEAWHFCRVLKGALIDQLAGYAEAPWEITADTKPAAALAPQ